MLHQSDQLFHLHVSDQLVNEDEPPIGTIDTAEVQELIDKGANLSVTDNVSGGSTAREVRGVVAVKGGDYDGQAVVLARGYWLWRRWSLLFLWWC